MPLSNAHLALLLADAATREERRSNRESALRRASVAALWWPEEAADVAAAGRPLTTLAMVGPWVAGRLEEWLTDETVDVPEPPATRSGFSTLAEARALLEAHPDWPRRPRCDLQTHTVDSDGRDTLEDMAKAAGQRGYTHLLVTDHSRGLRVAHGMDEDRLAEQGRHIEELNASLAAGGTPLTVLRGMEMNLSPQGEGDMDPAALRPLDVVLATFHSHLRETGDQTERYVAAMRNPTFQVFAHPRCRMWATRPGLRADWPRVFAEAAAHGKAVEVDCHPHRQDLDAVTLRQAVEAGCKVSIGTDAHSVAELGSMELGMATALRADVPADRILNLLPRDDLLAWARDRRR